MVSIAAEEFVMSSSEQAPEPTMDEILASIRRIIAEDDDGEGKQQEASEQSAPEPQSDEAERSELAASIAETLHQEDAMSSAVEEVLELTEEVEQIAVAASLAGDPPPQPEVSEFEAETAMAPDTNSPETDEAGVGDVTEVLVSEEVFVSEEVLVSEEVAPEPAEGQVPPMGEIPGVTQDAEYEFDEAPVESEQLDAAEVVEEAGESDTSIAASSIAEAVEAIARGTEPEPEDTDEGESPMPESAEAAPDEESATESQPDSVPSSSFYGTSAQAEAAKALQAETAEISAEESSVEAGIGASDTAEEEEEASEDLGDEEQPETEEAADSLEETLSPATNGPATIGSSAQMPTLETSVKEMLRPMLREWLDDNLPRIIENAVKDEIASSEKLKD